MARVGIGFDGSLVSPRCPSVLEETGVCVRRALSAGPGALGGCASRSARACSRCSCLEMSYRPIHPGRGKRARSRPGSSSWSISRPVKGWVCFFENSRWEPPIRCAPPRAVVFQRFPRKKKKKNRWVKHYVRGLSTLCNALLSGAP